MTPKGRETAAHHEAGLALVAGPRATADKVAKAQALPSQEVVDRATLLGILSEHGSQGNVVPHSQNSQEADLLDSARKADVRAPTSVFPR